MFQSVAVVRSLITETMIGSLRKVGWGICRTKYPAQDKLSGSIGLEITPRNYWFPPEEPPRSMLPPWLHPADHMAPMSGPQTHQTGSGSALDPVPTAPGPEAERLTIENLLGSLEEHYRIEGKEQKRAASHMKHQAPTEEDL